jgi:ribosome-associated protein
MAIQIEKNEVSFTYARGGGPGGQNVNKVASKAILRWNVRTSPSISDDVRQRFLTTFSSRVTVDGEVVIHANEFRDQPRNTAECLRRLQQMLDAVEFPPKPRIETEPTEGSKARRVDSKKRESAKKQNRRMSRADW